MDLSSRMALKWVDSLRRRKELAFLATNMSPRWYFLDYYVYPPLVLICLVLALDGAGLAGAVMAVGLVGLGLFAWTLAEYVIHRFVFHHVPLVMDAHMEHHAEPEGLHGSPTLVTVAVFLGLVFLPLWAVLTLASAAALTAGLMLGYLAYAGMHYLVHHPELLGRGETGSRARKALRGLIRAHAVHHHKVGYNFGVTTVFWDRVFGTLHRR